MKTFSLRKSAILLLNSASKKKNLYGFQGWKQGKFLLPGFFIRDELGVLSWGTLWAPEAHPFCTLNWLKIEEEVKIFRRVYEELAFRTFEQSMKEYAN